MDNSSKTKFQSLRSLLISYRVDSRNEYTGTAPALRPSYVHARQCAVHSERDASTGTTHEQKRDGNDRRRKEATAEAQGFAMVLSAWGLVYGVQICFEMGQEETSTERIL